MLFFAALALVVVSCAAEETEPAGATSTTPALSATTTTPTPGVDPAQVSLVYRLQEELWVDDANLGIEAYGPPRWRPGHNQITYGRHSDRTRAGIFLFEEIVLHDVATGEESILLDIGDHGWSDAGHFDWDPAGTRLVFAAQAPGAFFQPHILDVPSGRITRLASRGQVIDTVFTTDGRILGIDTSRADDQQELIAWVDEDGGIAPISPSAGVNRDPVVSPDGRFVANIRASNLLARVGIGRWDLIITDLTTGTEWVAGDGLDGFGPPRWIDSRTLVAKHARYSTEGVVDGIPDVALVDAETRSVTIRDDVAQGAWDPDPFFG
jgi:Tol biopolymer transport system component